MTHSGWRVNTFRRLVVHLHKVPDTDQTTKKELKSEVVNKTKSERKALKVGPLISFKLEKERMATAGLIWQCVSGFLTFTNQQRQSSRKNFYQTLLVETTPIFFFGFSERQCSVKRSEDNWHERTVKYAEPDLNTGNLNRLTLSFVQADKQRHDWALKPLIQQWLLLPTEVGACLSVCQNTP